MHRRLLFLLFLTIPLLAGSVQPPLNVTYMPFVYRQTAYADACQGQVVGTVYEDIDGDSRRDDIEVGLPGIRLTLQAYHSPDIIIATTDESGHYLMAVAPGQYELHADRQSGYRWTTPQAWGIDIVCATIELNFGLEPIEPSSARRPQPIGSMPPGPQS